MPITHGMVRHMKTTIELSDAVLAAAKRAAHEEGTTLRDVVERALRAELERHGEDGPFRLRDASVDGNGLRPAFAGGEWSVLRDAIYEGRGSV